MTTAEFRAVPLPTRRQHLRRPGRAARSAAKFRMETLESRTLMSATWATVDTVAGGAINDIAADAAGNVYAAGYDASGGVIRMKAASGSTWSTLVQGHAQAFDEVTVSAGGRLFVSTHQAGSGGAPGQGWILSWDAGSQSLVTIDSFASIYDDLHVAADGTLWATGAKSVQTGTTTTGTGKNKVTTPVYTSYGLVRKGIAGADGQIDFSNTFEPAGPARFGGITTTGAGVFVAGFTPAAGTAPQSWLVLKSGDGGQTWSGNVDPFTYDAARPSAARTIASDATGNLYVGGFGQETTITGYQRVKGVLQPIYSTAQYGTLRTSKDGGNTWATADRFSLVSSGGGACVFGIAVGADGVVYVAGSASDGNHLVAIVRSNEGGTWATVDTHSQDNNYTTYTAIAIDISTNTPYVAGHGLASGIVRSPAPPALTTGSQTTTSAATTNLALSPSTGWHDEQHFEATLG